MFGSFGEKHRRPYFRRPLVQSKYRRRISTSCRRESEASQPSTHAPRRIVGRRETLAQSVGPVAVWLACSQQLDIGTHYFQWKVVPQVAHHAARPELGSQAVSNRRAHAIRSTPSSVGHALAMYWSPAFLLAEHNSGRSRVRCHRRRTRQCLRVSLRSVTHDSANHRTNGATMYDVLRRQGHTRMTCEHANVQADKRTTKESSQVAWATEQCAHT